MEANTKPLVSIIIPSYNSQASIREAVESCLTQTYDNIEVIIVDDGSTDKTADMLKHYGKKINYFRTENQGGSAARNQGVDISRGEYIQFLDADDILLPNKIREQVCAIKLEKNDVIYGDWQFKGNLKDARVGGEPIRIMGGVDNIVDSLLDGWWCGIFSYIFHRKAIEGIRWDVALNCLQDYDFVIQVALSGANFHYHSSMTGYYCIHSDKQVTGSNQKQYAVCRSMVLDKVRAKLEVSSALTAKRCNFLAQGYWESARSFYYWDRDQFNKTLRIMNAICPKFKPKAGFAIRLLVKLLGIEGAEKILALRRWLKYKILQGT